MGSIMLDLVEDIFQQGVQLHKSGKVEIACQLYSAVLKVHPEHPTANHSMGVLAVEVGKVQEALVFFEAALEANPATAQFWLSYIDALIKLEKLADAKAVLDQAKSKGAKGDGFDTLETRLNERYEEPLEASKIASEPTPKKPNILDSLKLDQAISLAKKKAKEGSLEESKRIYQDILAKFPKNKRASDGLKGLTGKTVGKASKDQNPPQDQLQSLATLYSQGQLHLALKQAETLVTQFPHSAILFNIQGAALKGLGQLDQSVAAYNKALAIKPDYAKAYNNMGVALQEQGKLEEAIKAYNKALAIKSDYAEAYYNLGNALQEQGKLEEAIEAYNKALAIKPDYAGAHYNSSFALLNSGRLKEGLDAYEWRWKTAQFKSPRRHFLQPLWDGKTSLQDQRILVWCEQGVGDTIIWSSRLSLLVSQAGHCILECQKKLVPLLSRSFPNVEVKPVDVSRDTERDDFDFHLPMASLYRHFIPEITRSPKPDAFLMPDPGRVKFWKDSLSFLGGGPYVGISWKSSLMGAERSKHFSSLSEWSSLLTLPNINFINLQYADAADGLLQIQNEFGVKVHNFDDLDQYNDLDNVAALSAALDCVVSFGTSVPMITAGVGTLTKCPCLANGNYNNILGGPIGPLVDKFEKNTSEPWSNVFGLIADDISKL